MDGNFPEPDLSWDNPEANTASLDIFSKFSFFIKNVSHTPEHLLKELCLLNSFLDSSKTHFICGDDLTHLDCSFLPKLQHVRVASKAFKDFDIPACLQGVWRYLGHAYKCDTFQKTCPSDQEIVHHWDEKKETLSLPEEKAKLYTLETTPRFSLELPD